MFCIRARSRARYENNKEHALKYAREYAAANREKKKAYNAAYRVRNNDHLRARNAEWRKANPEKVKANISAWKKANPERSKFLHARSVAENKEKVRARQLRWVRANPEAVRATRHTRRARIKNSPGVLSKGLAAKLFKLQRGKCACCGLALGDNYHLDHIVPLALGGTNTDDNIQLLRAQCNLSKGAKHPVDFMQSRGLLL